MHFLAIRLFYGTTYHDHMRLFQENFFARFLLRDCREDREVRSTTLVPVSYIAHIASKDRCKPVARPVPSTVRMQRPSRSSRSHIRCAQLISGRISDLSLLPGVHRCVWVSVVPVETKRRACVRARGGTVVYARIGTGYRTPRDTRVGHASP